MNMLRYLQVCPSSSRLWAGLATWIVALSILTTGCVPTYDSRLRAYRDQGDLAAAEQLLDEAMRLDPGSLAAARERGILALERGASADAVPLLERVLRSQPSDERAAFYLALATDELQQWDVASVRYERYRTVAGMLPADLHTALIRHERAVSARGVRERLERAISGEEPAADRILFLPFDLQRPTPLARALRLGLAATLIQDWEAMPARAPVPLAEVQAFMAALGIEPDGPIDAPARERLARLTGASHVVYGRIDELSGSLRLEPSIADRRVAGVEPAVTRIEYLHGRSGTLLDLEKTILFRTARSLEVELTEERIEALRVFATRSALALQLFGETLWLHEAGSDADALDRIQRAVAQDPAFTLARELREVLAPGAPPAVAGEIDVLRGLYEHHVRLAEQAALQAEMLATASEHVGLIGGPEGETADLSINRPAGAGSASILIRLPR